MRINHVTLLTGLAVIFCGFGSILAWRTQPINPSAPILEFITLMVLICFVASFYTRGKNRRQLVSLVRKALPYLCFIGLLLVVAILATALSFAYESPPELGSTIDCNSGNSHAICRDTKRNGLPFGFVQYSNNNYNVCFAECTTLPADTWQYDGIYYEPLFANIGLWFLAVGAIATGSYVAFIRPKRLH